MAVLMTSGGVIPSTLPKVGTPLNDVSWEDISKISNLGLASKYFNVGNTKTIVINGKIGNTTVSNLSIDAFIIGIDHNASIEGNGIHFGIGKINGEDTCLVDSSYNTTTSESGKFTMNTTDIDTGGWASSHMRKTILGSDGDPLNPTANTFLAALPEELRRMMKPIKKYSDNVGGNGTVYANYVTVTEDYLPLLAEFEVYGAYSKANSYEQNYQKQYAYYADGKSKIKKRSDGSINGHWWLRSVYTTYAYGFCFVNNSGTLSTSKAHYSLGVSPIFMI